MKKIQNKINKLIIALKMRGIITYINAEQSYSLELKKTFTYYIVRFTTEENIVYRKELRLKLAINKELIKKCSKGSYEYSRLKQIIEGINSEIKFSCSSKNEFTSKVKILLFLADKYKELTINERS